MYAYAGFIITIIHMHRVSDTLEKVNHKCSNLDSLLSKVDDDDNDKVDDREY